MGIKLNKVAKAAKKYKHVLIVMRHAKAEPFGEKGDRDRNLTDKGLKQAKSVGKGLVALGLSPEQISCSSAMRTRQTLDRMLKSFDGEPIVDYRLSLYEGGVQSVFDELSHVKPKIHVFMIVGHEPTVSIASQWLASADSDTERLDLLNLGLAPASVVIMGSDKPFDEWQVHSGELIAVINVKDFD
ncbi:SixA phosphatase family protein [Bifidobacterium scaligerum]|uniref:Phosphoglycerate mutase n=1 Tax=Bifidobacterium scaligerum TaxID=2052656 RepID=A0A2M9HSY7_9BIFI|nr:histidine phosphatase family protein [Bifidobacterium scaligerum]PJM79908.1 phosphoglycerate mutase [Bifidobacterium scaligerum]